MEARLLQNAHSTWGKMMRMRKLVELIGFRNLVRLPGRTFYNLTDEDVALMIEAHSGGDNEGFEQSALSEFMVVPNKDAHLEQIRKIIIKIDESNRTPSSPDGLKSEEGLRALSDLECELRNRR